MRRVRSIADRLGAGCQKRRAKRIARRRLDSAAGDSFGLLTVEKHWEERHFRGRHLHVLLDGVDVTERCSVADDRQGYVGLFRRDARGRMIGDRRTGEPIIELRLGAVSIMEGAPFK